MNIAVLCSGLDDTHRGYETHQRMLFDALYKSFPDENIILYKRSGYKTRSEIPLGSPSRKTLICKMLGRLTESNSYWENFFFSLFFVIYYILFKPNIHTILVIEPGVSRTLGKLLKLLHINLKSYLYSWHCKSASILLLAL